MNYLVLAADFEDIRQWRDGVEANAAWVGGVRFYNFHASSFLIGYALRLLRRSVDVEQSPHGDD